MRDEEREEEEMRRAKARYTLAHSQDPERRRLASEILFPSLERDRDKARDARLAAAYSAVRLAEAPLKGGGAGPIVPKSGRKIPLSPPKLRSRSYSAVGRGLTAPPSGGKHGTKEGFFPTKWPLPRGTNEPMRKAPIVNVSLPSYVVLGENRRVPVGVEIHRIEQPRLGRGRIGREYSILQASKGKRRRRK